MKYYVVFKGHNPGVYDNWEEVKEQTNGFPGAVFKGYSTSEEATEAYRNLSGTEDRNELFRIISSAVPPKDESTSTLKDNPEVDWDAWAVDASCLGNPGKMEYRGVNLKTGEVLFQVGPFEDATNNIGEYLAIVHAMALMAKKGEWHNIYSDSRTAMSWVRKRKHNSKLQLTSKNAKVLELLARADFWLQNHRFPGVVRKWETERWGEIPADFGRK
ncbi:MAG: ribonuclease H family protein [Muribaculaceae bacterium]|nr:ribonuclease H family protein [Muribaculaceae bacterium]